MDPPSKRMRFDEDSDDHEENHDDDDDGFIRFQVTVGEDEPQASGGKGRAEKRDARPRGTDSNHGNSQRQRRRDDQGPTRAPNGPPRQHRGAYSIKSHPFESGSDSQGIVFHLGWNKKTDQWTNPVDTRKLRVCASSLSQGTLASTVDQDELFVSEDLPFSWVLFDFQECAVRPSRYLLAHQSNQEPCFMRSWQLEGSNDNRIWQVLSRHNNDGTLGPQRSQGDWELKTNTFFRYLRLVLDPNGNSQGGSAIAFHGYDVYGDLQVPTKSPPPVVVQPPPTPVSTSAPALTTPSLAPFQAPHQNLLPDLSAMAQMTAFPAQFIGGMSMLAAPSPLGGVPTMMLMNPGMELPILALPQTTRNLEDLRGQIWQHCLNRDEAQIIRDRLVSPECSMHEKQLVLDEVIMNLAATMNNRYGTYIVQALLEFSVPMHRKRLAAAMQTQIPILLSGPYSCFALLKALDFLSQDDVFLLAQEIRLHLPDLATQKIPSLILAKLFEVLPPTHTAFLVQAMQGAYQIIANTAHGTRVIHKILLAFKEHSTTILPMAEELLPCTLPLAQNPLGKDLVAALLRFGMAAHRKSIISILLMDWNELMQHPVACFCCKAAWDNADRSDKENIVRAMISDVTGSTALEVLYNVNSAGVLERVLGADNPQLRQALVDFFAPHASVIAGMPDRRKLLGLLDPKVAALSANQVNNAKDTGARGQGRQRKAASEANKRLLQ